jgi:hypothetical protein
VHARPRVVLAPHPTEDREDAFWIVDGRVVDWGPRPSEGEMQARSLRALARRRPAEHAPVPPDEVDEVRIVAAWLAEHEPEAIPL